MITVDAFLEAFKNEPQANYIRFATIDSGYTSGRPSVIFDGESVATAKAYPYLSSYTPTAGDRVMLVHGVIVGKII